MQDDLKVIQMEGMNGSESERGNERTRCGGFRLCAAAAGGDEQEVISLLATGIGADSSCEDDITLRSGKYTFEVDDWTALMLACWNGHGAVARLLLDAGADPNRQVRAETPLLLAAGQGHPALVGLLLERGAATRVQHPRGRRGSTAAITRAAKSGSPEAVRLLLEAGVAPDDADGNGYTALMAAVGEYYVDVIRLLISRGADPARRDKRGDSALSHAIDSANRRGDRWPPQVAREEILALLLSVDPPLDLRQAAGLGDAGAVGRLLAGGAADLDAEDSYERTALWHAIYAGHTEVAVMLLGQGATMGRRAKPRPWEPTALGLAADRGHADMMARLLDRNLIDLNSDGADALVNAAREGRAGMVRLLLDHGVPAGAGDGAPLLMAAARGQSDVLRLLLDADADPNQWRGPSGVTALMRLIEWMPDGGDAAKTAALVALLQHGADPALQDRDGRTALDIAAENGHEEAAALLRQEMRSVGT